MRPGLFSWRSTSCQAVLIPCARIRERQFFASLTARESPTVGTDAPPFPRSSRPGLPTLPHSGAGRGSGYRRSRFPAQRTVWITDAPGFPRSGLTRLLTLPHSGASLHRPPARNPHITDARRFPRRPRSGNPAPLTSHFFPTCPDTASLPPAFRQHSARGNLLFHVSRLIIGADCLKSGHGYRDLAYGCAPGHSPALLHSSPGHGGALSNGHPRPPSLGFRAE